jgi:ribosomal protein S6--L-glutamate ligase
MILSFNPIITADHQIILGSRKINDDDHLFIRKADAIILPQSCSEKLYLVSKYSPALIFPNYDKRFRYPGKIGQSRLFLENDCPHPLTKAWNSVTEFKEICIGSFPHEMPFIIKANMSHEAEGIHIINNNESFESAMYHIISLEKSGFMGFISQELVQSEGNVLRVVIMGKELISYWKRPKDAGQIITSAGAGARIDREWRPDLQEKGRDCGKSFIMKTGINLAAIDILFPIKEKDPQPLLLEINYYFGRRGLGGSLNYYNMLFRTIKQWLIENGLNPNSIALV